MQIFFVTGSAKSGTTWLQHLLDAHPEVTCSGEGLFIDHIIRPMIDTKAAFNAKQAEVGARSYGHRSVYPELTNAEMRPAIRHVLIALMRKRATETTRAIGDKTPKHNRALPTLNWLFPDARFINIVRHPADVVVSRLFHLSRRSDTPVEAMTPAQRNMVVDGAIQDWRASQTAACEFETKSGGRMVQLTYEDLLENTQAEATRLFGHLGVSTDADMVGEAIAAASFEKLSGGRQAGEQDPRSFFRKGVAGDWLETLTSDEARTVSDRCGDLMDRYGHARA